MKTLLLIGTFLVLLVFNLQAQSADTIKMERVFGGYQFYKGDARLNMNALDNIMVTNPFAYSVFKKARTTYNWNMLFSITGGVLIGWPLGTALGGGDPNWALAGAGAACIVITIPLSKKFNQQMNSAVNLYNADFRNAPTSQLKTQLNLGLTSNGLGLRYSF